MSSSPCSSHPSKPSLSTSGHFKNLNTSDLEEPLISTKSRKKIEEEYESSGNVKENNFACINLDIGGGGQKKNYTPAPQKEEEMGTQEERNNHHTFGRENEGKELTQEMDEIEEQSIQQQEKFEFREVHKSKCYRVIL